MFVDSWDVMRRGNMARALSQMQQNYVENVCTMHAMALGVAHLWLKDIRSASKHFDKFNKQHSEHDQCTYDLAGAAKWCLNERTKAVDQWREGLHVDYGDTCGLSIKPSMLLWFASVIDSELFPRDEAEGLLTKKAGDSRSQEWPLVQFVLGQIDEQRLRQHSQSGLFRKGDPRREEERLLHEWQADFWAGVVELSRGNTSRYGELMQRCGNLNWDDFDQDQNLFLSKVWLPEFFLARHEAERVV